MPCYHPLRASIIEGPGGKKLSFKMVTHGKGLALPCGRCIGCRLERARQWAVRILHEAKCHDDSVFVTLTYDEDHLPKDGSVSISTCQLFLKRLRARVAPTKIRFFLSGEYGEKFGRPHYHAIIFGHGFPDRVRIESSDERPLWRSALLESCWAQGAAPFGAVTFESASYVAQYALKKVTGRKANAHYCGRHCEFLLMSRRPGIGRAWIDRFSGDVYPADEVIVRGREARPPRYYDQVYAVRAPLAFEAIRAKREASAEALEEIVLKSGVRVAVAPSRNARRLVVREGVARAKLALKSRRLDA